MEYWFLIGAPFVIGLIPGVVTTIVIIGWSLDGITVAYKEYPKAVNVIMQPVVAEE